MTRAVLFVFCWSLLSLAAGAAEPATTRASHGPVTADISITPGEVDLSRVSTLVLTIRAPADIRVQLPSMADRLEGFTISGHFEDREEDASGHQILRHEYLLQPVVDEEYRLAPVPITYEDASRNNPETNWFPTPPITLQRARLSEQADVADLIGPARVPLSPRMKALIALGVLGAALLSYIAVRLAKRLRHEIALKRMSPRERAFRELEELINRNLVEQGMAQDFYYALTMIVRTYIERAHAVKAPEQTTEEFLAAVAIDPRFSPDVIAQLKAFLQAADLVKYAAQIPGPDMVDSSLSTARDYISHDAATPGELAGV